ncbi:MAG: patatin-like phospholipase family protein [Christensenellales bacterium]|jgi:NTE family protein
MKLQFDKNKEYAVALAGGGAKGAYQIGAWRAFEEAGLRIKAISGTSVGAINGAMLAMNRRELAEHLWKNISISQVIEYDDPQLLRVLTGDLGDISFRGVLRSLSDFIKARGLDITPLRQMMVEHIDEDLVRASDIELYIITYSLSERRELELRAKDLEPGTLNDMLLASAYLLAFRNEPLGGKRYADGALTDVLPINVLIENGYRDIIGIRLPSLGFERKVDIPEGVTVTIIEPRGKLGHTLRFDAQLSASHIKTGYLDAMRVLYGLAGEEYAIDRTLTERGAHRLLAGAVSAYFKGMGTPVSLREVNEKILPRLGRGLSQGADYATVLIRCLEGAAIEAGIDAERIYTDIELIELIKAEGGKYAIIPQIAKLYQDTK